MRSGQDLSAYFFVDDESIISLRNKEGKFIDSGVAIVSIKGERVGTTFITVVVRGGLDLHVSDEITVVDSGDAGGQEAQGEAGDAGGQEAQGEAVDAEGVHHLADQLNQQRRDLP